jgi:DUF1680 family protein
MENNRCAANTPQITITSDFWKRYRSMIIDEALPYQWRALNDEVPVDVPEGGAWGENGSAFSHSLRNLRIAAGLEQGLYSGQPFQDTDVSKWFEAASYALGSRDEDIDVSGLEQHVQEAAALFVAAQDETGYLDTKFEIDLPAEKRFTGLRWSHELYTMGHFIEAAVAYHQVTGAQEILDCARRVAQCIDDHFGDDEGKIHGPDGHPEIELALARLYEETGERRWLELSAWFIRIRGVDLQFFDNQDETSGLDFYPGFDMPLEYFVAASPALELTSADGHAVRLLYLVTAMAKVGRLLGDDQMVMTASRLWSNIVNHRKYVTGGVGSTTTGEAFTYDDDLPNATMYGETCAAVGMMFLGKELMEINPKSSVADVMEEELFNGALAGMQLDGTRYFYVNPLEADPKASQGNPGKRHVLTRRAGWFDCACCPANLVRLLTSLDKYLYTATDKVIYAHQFVANEARFDQGLVIKQTQKGLQYPWSGDIAFEVSNPEGIRKSLGIRIPQWAEQWSLDVEGKNIPADETIDGFVFVDISEPSTSIHLVLDMPVRYVRAANRVRADVRKLAVARGPIVYCMEEVDNEAPLWLDDISAESPVTCKFDERLLGGIVSIVVQGSRLYADASKRQLYDAARAAPLEYDQELHFIPYYAWCNRSEGQMQVWVNEHT